MTEHLQPASRATACGGDHGCYLVNKVNDEATSVPRHAATTMPMATATTAAASAMATTTIM
jgi:hypothetical protein